MNTERSEGPLRTARPRRYRPRYILRVSVCFTAAPGRLGNQSTHPTPKPARGASDPHDTRTGCHPAGVQRPLSASAPGRARAGPAAAARGRPTARGAAAVLRGARPSGLAHSHPRGGPGGGPQRLPARLPVGAAREAAHPRHAGVCGRGERRVGQGRAALGACALPVAADLALPPVDGCQRQAVVPSAPSAPPLLPWAGCRGALPCAPSRSPSQYSLPGPALARSCWRAAVSPRSSMWTR